VKVSLKRPDCSLLSEGFWRLEVAVIIFEKGYYLNFTKEYLEATTQMMPSAFLWNVTSCTQYHNIIDI